ncbi:hypothetical protein ACP70R_050136 [Stipagrostis hirtigluma subsp. patula]
MPTIHGGGGGAAVGRRHKFFKVLLPGSFERSLSIPPRFAAGLACRRRCAAAAATLRDPAGRSWDVDLDRDDDDGGGRHRVCFAGHGWRGFVSANGVSAGHLLVFEHRGGLDFAVDLFDASGCLRDDVAPDEHHAAGHVQAETTTYASTDDDLQSGNKRRAGPAPAAPCCNGVKRRKRPSSTTGSCDDDEEDAPASHGHGRKPGDETLHRRIEKPYELRVLELSKSFCERVGWTASRGVELRRAAGDDGDEEEAGRRRWPVSVKVSAKGGMICGGWEAFARDNGLRLSDACVFLPLQLAAAGGCNVLEVQVLRNRKGNA